MKPLKFIIKLFVNAILFIIIFILPIGVLLIINKLFLKILRDKEKKELRTLELKFLQEIENGFKIKLGIAILRKKFLHSHPGLERNFNVPKDHAIVDLNDLNEAKLLLNIDRFIE